MSQSFLTRKSAQLTPTRNLYLKVRKSFHLFTLNVMLGNESMSPLRSMISTMILRTLFMGIKITSWRQVSISIASFPSILLVLTKNHREISSSLLFIDETVNIGSKTFEFRTKNKFRQISSKSIFGNFPLFMLSLDGYMIFFLSFPEEISGPKRR